MMDLEAPPQVANAAHHRHPIGHTMHGNGYRNILIQDPLRELEMVLQPKAAQNQLIPGSGIINQAGIFADMCTLCNGVKGALVQRRVKHLGRIKASHIANGQFTAVALGQVKHRLVRVRGNHIVRVQKGNVLAGGKGRAHIPCPTQAAVLLAMVMKIRIRLGITLCDLAAAVLGAIVDQNYFQIILSLFHHRVQTRLQVLLHIINRNNYANIRCRMFHSFLLFTVKLILSLYTIFINL